MLDRGQFRCGPIISSNAGCSKQVESSTNRVAADAETPSIGHRVSLLAETRARNGSSSGRMIGSVYPNVLGDMTGDKSGGELNSCAVALPIT